MKKIIYMLVMVSLSISLVGCSSKSLSIEKDEFIVEFGSDISLDPKLYLSKDTKNSVVDQTVIEFANDSNYKIDEKKKTLISTSKNNIPVGKYKAFAKYKNEKIDFSVKVQDTTKPEFSDFKNEISIEVMDNIDLNQYFKATDLSDVKITYTNKEKEKPLNTKEAGSYNVIISAEDKYGNRIEKECNIIVTDKTEEQKKGEDNNNEVSTAPSNNGNNAPSSNNGNINASGNSGGSNEPQQPTQPEPPKPNTCVSNGQFGRVGNSGKTFSSKAEADSWAENYILGQTDWVYSGWYAWTVYDNCGERNDVWTVDFY